MSTGDLFEFAVRVAVAVSCSHLLVFAGGIATSVLTMASLPKHHF